MQEVLLATTSLSQATASPNSLECQGKAETSNPIAYFEKFAKDVCAGGRVLHA
jgi:hypothetical protein